MGLVCILGVFFFPHSATCADIFVATLQVQHTLMVLTTAQFHYVSCNSSWQMEMEHRRYYCYWLEVCFTYIMFSFCSHEVRQSKMDFPLPLEKKKPWILNKVSLFMHALTHPPIIKDTDYSATFNRSFIRFSVIWIFTMAF